MKTQGSSLPKDCFTLILQRCFILYVLAAVVFLGLINHKKVIYKTLDRWQRSPEHLIEFARGKVPFNLFRLRYDIRYYQNLIKVAPNLATAYSDIGFCYYYLGELDKAIAYHKKAISLDPKLFGLHYNLGQIYFQKGNIKEAVKSFEKAIEVGFDAHSLQTRVITPFEKGDSAELGDNAVILQKGYSQCYQMIIKGYEQLNDYQNILVKSIEAIKTNPGNEDIFYYYAGLASFKLKDYKNAAVFLIESLKLNPKRVETYHYLGLVFHETGKEETSQEILKEEKRLEALARALEDEINYFTQDLYYYPSFLVGKYEGKAYLRM